MHLIKKINRKSETELNSVRGWRGLFDAASCEWQESNVEKKLEVITKLGFSFEIIVSAYHDFYKNRHFIDGLSLALVEYARH